MAKKTKLKVVELFAGVGGFRLGLEGHLDKERELSPYQVVWSNQWEPSTKVQHASIVYESQFGDKGGIHSNEDIFQVVSNPEKFLQIQKVKPDVLVGGFPCQDYSVAKPLNKSKGLVGEKGVLWWSIYGLIENRIKDKEPIKYLILENVDRLIKSPTAKRGRDFAIMLSSLFKLGYAVEWRVVNAADYGFPQRRRRIFIVAYHQSTKIYKKLEKFSKDRVVEDWLSNEGVLAKALPVQTPDSTIELPLINISDDPHYVTESYQPKEGGKSMFENAGVALNGLVWTRKVESVELKSYKDFIGSKLPKKLGDVVAKTKSVPDEYYIDMNSLKKWKFYKDAKSVERVKKNGIKYTFDEGGMQFPDLLDRPARTIITGEGGSSPSRFKHVIEDKSGKLRRLTPEELEELNGFPRGFTKHPQVVDAKRAFFMGNALVVGVVKVISRSLAESI
uniref:DNA cytosine methyltransferase n=1 Tax=Polynucleobacter sp. TaxID=2029855 RepID=UPI004047E962